MEKNIKNYIQFVLSLIIMGFGIALITSSNLGTSAISSVPYVLSRVFNLSFGTFTLLVNLFYFFIQLVVLNKSFPKEQYFQVIIGPILGFFIDLSMNILKGIRLENYSLQMIVLLVGCIIVGFSIFLQVEADVVTNPTEGIVKLIANKSNQTFSKIKTMFDVFLVVLSVSISYISLGKIVGVREGTLISAFFVGYVIRFINYIKENV